MNHHPPEDTGGDHIARLREQSSALDGWSSTPIRRASSSLRASPPASAHPRSLTDAQREEKSPSAFYDGGAFQLTQDEASSTRRGSSAGASSTPRQATPTAPAQPSAPVPAGRFTQPPPLFHDTSQDYKPEPTGTPTRPSRLPWAKKPVISEDVRHEHLSLRVQQLPRFLNNTSVSLRGAPLRSWDVDRPTVDREFGPARESSAATSEIRQVVAHGDGCFVYVNTPDFKQFTGRRIAIHTLPDKLAIRQRAEAQPRKDKEVLGVWIQDIKDSRGKRPFWGYTNDTWTFLSRVALNSRSSRSEIASSMKHIRTNWLLRGKDLPPEGILVAFVFRTVFEPHSRPNVVHSVEQFELGKRRGPRVFKEGASYERWRARGGMV